MAVAYRSEVYPFQIFARLTRQDYIHGIEKTLSLLSPKNILQITHRPKQNRPAFSPHYMNVLVSRFGEVRMVLQITHNSFLVVFGQEESARVAISKPNLGTSNNRFIIKSWDPKSDLRVGYYIARLLESSCQTPNRMSCLMHQHASLAWEDPIQRMARDVLFRTRGQGFCLKTFCCPSSDPNIKDRQLQQKQQMSVSHNLGIVKVVVGDEASPAKPAAPATTKKEAARKTKQKQKQKRD